MRILFLIVTSIAFWGCSTVPENLRTAPANSPTIPVAVQQFDNYRDTTVFWGGAIIAVENQKDDSWVEIIAYPLNSGARPRLNTSSQGRFILRIDGFADPLEFSSNREISVIGTLQDKLTKTVGQFQYIYPVLLSQQLYLWPKRIERDEYYDPFWYDPWYPWSPWYPYYPPYRYPYPPTKRDKNDAESTH